MSTHYTPAKVSLLRLIQWRHLVFKILIPLMLIVSTVSAFVDGVSYALYVLTATWMYILLVIGMARGGERAIQANAVAGAIFFLVGGVRASIMGEPPDPLSPLLMAAVVFGTIAFAIQLHFRIERIGGPSQSARAVDHPGIYRITCTVNQMEYIGLTSRPIKARWHDHQSDLDAGRHHNTRMQLDWNTYGPSQFKWEVLEVVTDQVWLYDRERFWQNLDYETTRRYNPPNIPRGK